MNRRNFFRNIAQGGLFTLLTGTGAYLSIRKPSTGDNCDFDFVCQNCRKEKICQLPEASKFRLNKRKNEVDGS